MAAEVSVLVKISHLEPDFAGHLLREVVTWQPVGRLVPQTGGANTSFPCAQRKHVEGRPSSPPGLQTPNFVQLLFFRLLCFISWPVCQQEMPYGPVI